jgi:hypothetical protein
MGIRRWVGEGSGSRWHASYRSPSTSMQDQAPNPLSSMVKGSGVRAKLFSAKVVSLEHFHGSDFHEPVGRARSPLRAGGGHDGGAQRTARPTSRFTMPLQVRRLSTTRLFLRLGKERVAAGPVSVLRCRRLSA